MVKQWNIWFWNSATFDNGTVEHVMVEQCNLGGGTVDLRWWKSERSDYGTVEQSWLEKRTADGGKKKHLMVELWNI